MQFFLVSHGQLAKGMKNSIEMISGKHDNLHAFSMDDGDNPSTVKEKVKNELNKYLNEEIILVSDFPGGSINTMLTDFINNKIFLLSGMNIMMILELILNKNSKNIQQLIDSGIISAKKSIVCVNENLNSINDDMGDDFFD